eukprot:COSAG03_NODE_16501_length_400_cov_0.514950_1_plen_32_part_01
MLIFQGQWMSRVEVRIFGRFGGRSAVVGGLPA